MTGSERFACVLASCCLAFACSGASDASPPHGGFLAAHAGEEPSGGEAGTSGAADLPVYADTTELDVPVPDAGRVYVKLSTLSVVEPTTPGDSSGWDLAFEGFNAYTNSGPSGTGSGGAFGLLDISTLLADNAPTVPFISPDKAGGAFVDWYAYDGSSHALYSRCHVYGVKNGGRLWKTQVLSYYSEQDNAPVSALYQIRYAELGSSVGATQTLQVDGTAGGLAGSPSDPSGCLDLATGTLSKLTPADARKTKSWDLCFRRDSISVNDEAGGPRGVGAVDLQAADTSTEILADVKKETAGSALPGFTKVSASSFADAQFRGDHVVSAFETGTWLDSSTFPPSAAFGTWLVLDSAGKQEFLVAFGSFRNPTTSSPGTVVMHIKPVTR